MTRFLKRSSLILAALVPPALALNLSQQNDPVTPGYTQPGQHSGCALPEVCEANGPGSCGGSPLGLPPVAWPEQNPYTPEKVELGKLLFFDRRLSSDGSVSCASCHDPKYAFSDGAARSLGIGGQQGGRNAPTIINCAYSSSPFWDGRTRSLEEQAREPLANPTEMTCDPTTDLAHHHTVERLKAVPGYVERFQRVFGTPDFSIDHVVQAIATFERTVLSGNSPLDRYLAGDARALTPAQRRGMDVFFGKAACNRCHLGPRYTADLFYEHDELTLSGRRIETDPRTGREVPEILGFNFTDGSFQNTGIGMDSPDPDLGRHLVTGRQQDLGAFKVPTLREIEHTAPYMHDGSLKTLEEVVDHYDQGGIKNPQIATAIAPLHLTALEKTDLVAFLTALSGEGWQQIKAPEELPQ